MTTFLVLEKLTRKEQKKMKEMKYKYANALPQLSPSCRQIASPVHANIMSCQFSPVADLQGKERKLSHTTALPILFLRLLNIAKNSEAEFRKC